MYNSTTDKVCFVIMGFGKKPDYSTSRSLDLDQTYNNIIKPAVEQSNFTCIRADEIRDSGLIDRSMYALIMKAELVIADISTYNPNVLYELGIRHAVKPFSTIIINDEECNLPFDLDHTRIFKYKHSENGNIISADEAKRCLKELQALINEVVEKKNIDSPLYEFLKLTKPPLLDDSEYRQVVDVLAKKEKTVFSLVEKAKEFMHNSNSENNLFQDACSLWLKVEKLLPKEEYFTQQLALCTYKSELPNVHSALINALIIIDKLNPYISNDVETLGISGAICRRLYECSNDINCLERAIVHYGRGYELANNYYNGENYAFCLDLKRAITKNVDEQVYYKFDAKKTREKIIINLETLIKDDDLFKYQSKKWVYASLANCNYGLNNDEEGKLYESKFVGESPDSWELKTFNDSKNTILKLRS